MYVCVLQSETCSVLIPELEFEFGMAALGGKFTTLEGLLKDIKDLVGIKALLTVFSVINRQLLLCLFYAFLLILDCFEKPLHVWRQHYIR